MDDWISGFLDKWIQRHAGLESGAFALSCLLAFLMVIPACAKVDCEKKVDRHLSVSRCLCGQSMLGSG